jgi:hypothetical protein
LASFRSRRIEALLGSSIDGATQADVTSLITTGAVEDFDLDFKEKLYGFKEKLYGNGDSDKRALAGDVAAMANTAGGLIVIGVQEDDQARAASAPGVPLSDDETRRMTQIIAGISPLPVVEIRAIPSAADPNHGFYLLAVPRSPRGPHAVPVNGGLRYPKRNGSTIRYLSEPEVADAYRQRASGGQNQTDRLDEILDDALARLDKSDYPWLVVALMPELTRQPRDRLRRFHCGASATRRQVPLFFDETSYMHAGVARRRYVLGGGSNQTAEKYLAADLHTDGGGAFAEQLEDVRRNHAIVADNSVPYLISDESVVEGLITVC